MRSPVLTAAARVLLASCVVLTATAPVFAEEKAPEKKSKRAPAETGPRKDPLGVTGISPYTEALAKGHALIAARDLAGGIGAYQEAITSDPDNPLGHYFLGAARVMKNELNEAKASLESAVRFSSKNDELHGKALFQLADLDERQDKLEEAKKDWDAYIQFVEAHPKAHGFAQTGAERMKACDKRIAIVKSATEVKARIEQRLKEVGAPPPDDGPQGPGSKSTKKKLFQCLEAIRRPVWRRGRRWLVQKRGGEATEAMFVPTVLVCSAGCLVFGVLLVLVGHRFDRAQRAFNRHALSAAGTVIGHTAFTVSFRDRLEAQTEARVRFRAANGQFYEAKGPVYDARNPPVPPIGTVIDVLYDPADPRESSTRGPRGRAGLAPGLFWLGVAFVVLGILGAIGGVIARAV
jgi:tetratricopeptide (TPR) repeat protein